MEKQRNNKRNRFIIGLLVLFCTPLFAAPRPLTPSQIRELTIAPAENQSFLTGKEINYKLLISGINPASVEITNPRSTDTVTFKTLRKTSDQNSGTKIELWYEFLKAGTVRPEPLEIKISGRTYHIPFDFIEIEEDPANLKPKLVIKFSNGVQLSSAEKNLETPLFDTPVSKPVSFTVYVQYSTQVINLDYDIPKKALLTNTEVYEITEIKHRERSYSHNLIPVAAFEWTPLIKGQTQIPEIRLKATSYDGLQAALSTPKAFVTVTGKNHISSASQDKDVFEDSFLEMDSEENSHQNAATLDEVLLRIDRQRKLYLKLLFISIILMVIASVVLLLVKIKNPVPYIIIASIALTSLILFSTLYKKETAVYTGGAVSSIPELQAGKYLQINENTEVKIVKETAEWYCIEADDSMGWTLKKNIMRY